MPHCCVNSLESFVSFRNRSVQPMCSQYAYYHSMDNSRPVLFTVWMMMSVVHWVNDSISIDHWVNNSKYCSLCEMLRVLFIGWMTVSTDHLVNNSTLLFSVWMTASVILWVNHYQRYLLDERQWILFKWLTIWQEVHDVLLWTFLSVDMMYNTHENDWSIVDECSFIIWCNYEATITLILSGMFSLENIYLSDHPTLFWNSVMKKLFC